MRSDGWGSRPQAATVRALWNAVAGGKLSVVLGFV